MTGHELPSDWPKAWLHRAPSIGAKPAEFSGLYGESAIFQLRPQLDRLAPNERVLTCEDTRR
jgi:hypothetical protein